MTNKRYAKKLASMADEMLHPQGCVYDALMAGAAALRAVEVAKAALRPFADGDHVVPADFDRAAAALAELEAPNA